MVLRAYQRRRASKAELVDRWSISAAIGLRDKGNMGTGSDRDHRTCFRFVRVCMRPARSQAHRSVSRSRRLAVRRDWCSGLVLAV